MEKSTNQRKHFASLDAFRGLAAVMIVLYHSSFYASSQPNLLVKHSAVFVDFFFVLSGFVMAYAYLDRIHDGLSLKRFVILRLARLYPLHLFTLLIWVPYIGVKYYLYQHGIGATDPGADNNMWTFVQNLLLLQGFSTYTSWNYPSWSISVEFYTYIVFYISVLVLTRFLHTRFLLNLFFVTIGTSLLLFELNGEFHALTNLLRCIAEFFLGVSVYLLYRHYVISIEHTIVASTLELLSLGSVLYLVVYTTDENSYRIWVILLFVWIVYLFASESSGILSKLLQHRFFQHLGKISYSIYMVHAIIVTGSYNVLRQLMHLKPGGVATVAEGIVVPYALWLNIFFLIATIAAATWTYYHIELPGQAWVKKRI